MEIIPACYENLKRCWRRRKYKRLNNFGYVCNNKRNLKVARLGGGGSGASMAYDLGLAVVSPLKFLARFPDAYVAMMMKVAINVEKMNYKGLAKGKKVAKDGSITRVSIGEEVQDMLVLEIYKRLVASSDVGHR